MTMTKKFKYEIVSHDKIAQLRQENDSKQFKLEAVQLPLPDLKDAERVLARIPVTNKLYKRLQNKIEAQKSKEERKKREQELDARIARIKQQEAEDEHDLNF